MYKNTYLTDMWVWKNKGCAVIILVKLIDFLPSENIDYNPIFDISILNQEKNLRSYIYHN